MLDPNLGSYSRIGPRLLFKGRTWVGFRRSDPGCYSRVGSGTDFSQRSDPDHDFLYILFFTMKPY